MLSIIIVSYNVKYFLEQCLFSVQKAIAGMEAEVIVVDNHSADNTIAYLQEKFSWVRFVANTVNTGYAKANNQGWQLAVGDYILFLNPDTILSENCLQQSLAALAQDARRGALGIHMVDGSGCFLPESKRGFPSPAIALFKLLGLTRIFPGSKTIAGYYQGHLSEKEDNEIAVLSGAYMMVKKQVLQKTGGFDEQFFMYGEDIDLSYRIKQAGYTNYYLACSSIVHFKGESTKKNFAYTRLFYKAMAIFVEKHYGKQSRGWALLAQGAIGLGGAVSYLRQQFTGPISTGKNNTLSTLVVGEAVETAKAIAALENDGSVKRCITTVTAIREIATIPQPLKTSEIIFCAGDLAYSEIIDCMGRLGKGIAYKFFARGSKSMVGSASKNNSGEVVVVA